MTQLIWSQEAWELFKEEIRKLNAFGIRGDALWRRLDPAMAELYASADPANHAQVYEDAVRYLIACGYLPESMAP